MLSIPCPWCGPRDETEFVRVGEADRPRPADPAAADPETTGDVAWADHLFMRAARRGELAEILVHAGGCGRFLRVAHDSVSHALLAVQPAGQPVKGAA